MKLSALAPIRINVWSLDCVSHLWRFTGTRFSFICYFGLVYGVYAYSPQGIFSFQFQFFSAVLFQCHFLFAMDEEWFQEWLCFM